MHTTSRLLDFATFYLRVVAFGNFDTRPQDRVYFDSLDDLLCTFSLEVDTDNLTIRNCAVLNFHGVIRICKTVNSSRFEINELSVRDKDI